MGRRVALADGPLLSRGMSPGRATGGTRSGADDRPAQSAAGDGQPDPPKEERDDDMAEDVLAPLAGKVLSISVSVGDQVDEDDEVLVIEAMKMETVVYAPTAGRVTALRVSVGDQVDEDDPLAAIGE